MNIERLWLLFLVALPVIWMTVHSCRGYFNSLPGTALRVALVLSAFSLPALATDRAAKPSNILADALKSLSDNDLKKLVLSRIPGVC
jgi:hypothetical protein